MTAREGQEELEAQFGQWRQYVQRRRELQPSDADELEDHLRGSVDELVAVGLSADEAFLVAVKRMGSLDELSREFAREHSERLWKQLVLTGEAGSPMADTRSRWDLWAMVICAAGAAASIKVPELFGLRLADDGAFYARNLTLFALPWLAVFLAWRRQARRPLIGTLVALFGLGAVAANAYPLAEESKSLVLTSIHLPIALWLVVGLAYVADDWRSSRRRMDFIRFTGEWLIYFFSSPSAAVCSACSCSTPSMPSGSSRRSSSRSGSFPAAPWPGLSWPGGWSRPSRAWSKISPRCSRGYSLRCSRPHCWPSSSPSSGPAMASTWSAKR
ncbi:permease prefix domain 1-containing protein [Micromonospora sp. DT47]|uniref:permease prefix domain 1-containing protein n=1 Tax=Micromonospora sp. DT47 TaxID=3393431 RepID=UPI003CF93E39